MKEKMDVTYESLKEATNTDTVFCRSLVSTGMLTEEQTRRAAGRYCLGRSKDGGVVFWEIDGGLRVRDEANEILMRTEGVTGQANFKCGREPREGLYA